MRRLLPAVLLIVLLGSAYHFRGLVFGNAGDAGPARAPASQPVRVDDVVAMAAPIQVSAIGSAQSIATVMVKSRIDGQIAEVRFKEGQEVKEGDLLFTLDDRALKAQLAQSEATLERDRASLQRAKLEVARQSGLANRGVASAQKFEDVETSLAVLEATVRADEAAVENARVNLDYATILAPIDGRTGSIALKKGNLVKASELSSQIPLVTGLPGENALEAVEYHALAVGADPHGSALVAAALERAALPLCHSAARTASPSWVWILAVSFYAAVRSPPSSMLRLAAPAASKNLPALNSASASLSCTEALLGRRGADLPVSWLMHMA